MWRSLVVLFVILGSAQGGDGSEGTSAVPSSAPVDCAAVFPGINEACCGALSSNASSHLPMVRRPLARMAYASGSSLPYDAGHYTTCVNTEGAGYFTLSWHIDGRDVPVAELGLCLPAACRKADVERLIGAKSGDGISAGAIANNTEEAVAKAEAMLRPFGTSFCARAEVDAAAAAHCREYRAVIAVMDAAADMASELAGDGDGAGVTVGPFSLGGSDSVRVSVTSSAEERVGFFDNAKSGWAAFCLVLTVVLLIVAIVGTVLDALETTGWDERDGTTSEPLLRDAGGEAVDGGGDEEVDEDEAEELVDAGEDGERDSQHRVLSKVAEGMKMFSIRRNWPKLVAAPAEPSPTDCLNGMRVLSMVWIVLGHTMMMPAPINGFDNPEDLVAKFGARSQVWFMTVIGGQIAVDTFFFLGGFLVAYLGVRDLEKRGGKIPYGAMVLHRYLRITPAFAFTMVFYSQIVSRIGDGPFFVRFQHSVFRRCDNASWVTSLVYLHNFVPFDSDQVCMGWSWYLGCDMIFFILSPALLLLHHHRPKVMWTVMIAAAVASSALTFWLVVHYDLGCYVFGKSWRDYTYYAYSKPYTRVPAHLVGMAFGFVNERWVSDPSTRPVLNRAAVKTWGAAAIVALFACVFAPLSDYRDPESWSPWVNAAFITACRPVWAAGLGVVTTLCAAGRLEGLNAFLAHPGWIPFARLTFGTYLMHPVVIKWFAGTATSSYHFGWRYMTAHAMFNAAFSFLLAAGMYLLVERPVMSALKRGRRAGRDDSTRQ